MPFPFRTSNSHAKTEVSKPEPAGDGWSPAHAQSASVVAEQPQPEADAEVSAPPTPAEPPAGTDDGRAPRGPAPGRVDALTAALRYPWLVLIPAIALAGAAVVLTSKKATTYTASSSVLVGQPTPGTSGELPGVVQAELSLTGIYAREISFDGVTVPLARKFHTTPGAIAQRLAATPAADSPIIRVDATGKSAASAAALANAAGSRFAAFVNSQAQTQTGRPANNVLGQYQAAAAELARARAHEQHLSSQNQDPSSPEAVQASVATQVAQLRQTLFGNQYQNLVTDRQNYPSLNMFQSAHGATSNRTSNLELYLFAGIIAGLVIGTALATLLANRHAIRTRALA